MPQRSGDWIPAGGGTCFAVVRNSSPRNPSGVHATIAIVPPGFVTRTSSEAAFSWSGANMDPNMVVTASNDAAG